MLPLIAPGDKIVVEKSSSYKTDDVVVFYKNGKLIAHRLIYKNPRGRFLITKGDNNLKADGKIKENQILGKVNKIKRKGRTINLSHIYLTQSSTYFSELRKVVDKLSEINIDFIILKGLPVHIFVSNSPPKRIYLDADILIKKKDFIKTKKVLEKLGFYPYKSELFGKKIKKATQITLVKKTEPFPTAIDLHLEPAIGFTRLKEPNLLLPPLKPFTEYLFSNIQKVSQNKTSFPVLKESALMLYLLAHLYHHNFQGAHRLQLISELSKNKKINWQEVSEKTKKYGLKNYLYPTLLILKKYYPSSVSQKDLNKFRPKISKMFFAKTVPLLVNPFNEGGRSIEAIKRLVFLFLFSGAPLTKRLKIVFGKRIRSYYFPTIKSLFPSL